MASAGHFCAQRVQPMQCVVDAIVDQVLALAGGAAACEMGLVLVAEVAQRESAPGWAPSGPGRTSCPR